MTSYRGYDDQEPYSSDDIDNPETKEFPAVEDYQVDDYNYQNDGQQLYEEEEPEYIHLAWENLPDDQKSGEFWVSREPYEKIYYNLDSTSQENSRLHRLYETAYHRNESLLNESRELRDENNRLQMLADSARSKTDAREKSIKQREEELEEKEKKNKIVKYSLIAATAIFAILFIIFFFMWHNLSNDTSANSQNNEVKQEQLSNLKNSLESERQAKNDAVAKQTDLQNQLDTTNKQLSDANKNLEDTKKQLDDSDKNLNELVKKIDELEKQTASPTTITETARVPGDSQTVTETFTTTVTEQTGGPSGTDSANITN